MKFWTILCLKHILLKVIYWYAAPFVLGSVPKSQHFLINILPNLDESRFRELVRVSWSNFKILLELIQTDEIFNGPRSSKQIPVSIQLMIVLYRLGSSGEGATITKIASFFGIVLSDWYDVKYFSEIYAKLIFALIFLDAQLAIKKTNSFGIVYQFHKLEYFIYNTPHKIIKYFEKIILII